MNQKEQRFTIAVANNPVRIDIDPEFDLFRRLNYNEIPPSLSTALGAEKTLIILSSSEGSTVSDLYDTLATN